MQDFTASLKGDFTPEQAEAMKAYNENLAREFRANQGQVQGDFAGAPLLLLTTTGAKSGQPRTTPLVYARDGDSYVIFASKAGMDTHPAWYHNLVANPQATLEVGGQTLKVLARFASGAERQRLFDQQVALMPAFGEYQRKTEREIPVVVLTLV